MNHSAFTWKVICLMILVKKTSLNYNQLFHFSGQNKIAMIGGGEAEVASLRHNLQSKWPYPVTYDKMLQSSKGTMGYQVCI